MDKEPDVTQESSPEPEQPVTNPEDSGTQEEPTQDIPEQGDAQPELDRPVQNYEAEWKRKYEQVIEQIPDVVKSAVQEVQQTKEENKYKIEELEAFLETEEDPKNRAWAKQKIREIDGQKRKQELKELLDNREKSQREAQVKIQVEQQVLANPLYNEAFIKDKTGNRVFNQAHPLTQYAAGYMKDPRIANDPEGLGIAMKLAYADYAAYNTGQSKQKLETIKRQNAKLKQSAMVEGSGVNHTPKPKTAYQESMQQLRRTGSKAALRNVTKEILKKQGLIKE